jgi:pilus assembly protein TadC
MSEKEERIPFIYFPKHIAKKLSSRFVAISNIISPLFPDVKEDLKTTELNLKKNEFLSLIFLNALSWFFLMSIFLFGIIVLLDARTPIEAGYFGIGLGLFMFFIILMITGRYPKIIAGKKAEQIEKNLVFALKDMLLQISAGKPLYDSMVAVSELGYGELSKEFSKTIKQIQSGVSMDKALENMVIRSNSEYLKKTIWQLISVIKSGSNLKVSLKIIIADLLANQKDKIKSYSQELNMWSLVYMMFAVAGPTIGFTFLLIMSATGLAGDIGPSAFIYFSIACIVLQYIIIGLIQSRRPVIDI